MKRATVPALLAGLFLATSTARALETPLGFRGGDWDVTAGAGYFSTNSNFVSGHSESLPSGGSYQLLNTSLSTRYVSSRTWAFFGETNVGTAQSNGLDASRSNSSLTHVLGGAQLNVELGNIRLIPEVSFLFPIEKVTSTQDTVMNSEGVNETRLRARGQIAWGRTMMFGLIGYDMRGGGRSHLMPWSLGVDFRPGGFHLGARIFGFNSLTDDADKGAVGEAARMTTSLRVNGGSLRFYGVNPSVVDTEGYALFDFGRFSLGLAGGMVMTGSSAANGFHADAALTFKLGGASPSSRSRVNGAGTGPGPVLSVDPEEDEFKEDVNDGIDQKIFRPPPPPRKAKPKPAAPEVDPELDKELIFKKPTESFMDEPSDPYLPAPEPVVPKVEDPQKRQRKMQKELDDAEMTIQLKVDKKRKRRK